MPPSKTEVEINVTECKVRIHADKWERRLHVLYKNINRYWFNVATRTKSKPQTIGFNDLLYAIKQIEVNKAAALPDSHKVKEFIKAAFPYAIALTGVTLTIIGLYMQSRFHTAQMEQSGRLHLDTTVFNIALHEKNIKRTDI